MRKIKNNQKHNIARSIAGAVKPPQSANADIDCKNTKNFANFYTNLRYLIKNTCISQKIAKKRKNMYKKF